MASELTNPKNRRPTHVGRPTFNSPGYTKWLCRREVKTCPRTLWCVPEDTGTHKYHLHGSNPCIYLPVYEFETRRGTRKDVRGAGPAKRVRTSVTRNFQRKSLAKFGEEERKDGPAARRRVCKGDKRGEKGEDCDIEEGQNRVKGASEDSNGYVATAMLESLLFSARPLASLCSIEQDDDEWESIEEEEDSDFGEYEESRGGVETGDEWDVV